MQAYDTTNWVRVVEWDAHPAFIRDGTLKPGGEQMVSTGEDDTVRIWDVNPVLDRTGGPELLLSFPAAFPSDAVWMEDDSLVIFLAFGAQWVRIPLATEALIAEAEVRLTRGFTDRECATYQIEDCPMTLEAIRGG